MSKITGDKYLVKTLAAYDVSHFFYMPLIFPGAVRLMEEPEHQITPVSCHTEGAAAYMADGFARATGKPGICGSQGIGRGNLLAGLHDAFMARSPVIALTGGNPPEFRYRGSYQDLNNHSGFSVTTKFNASIDQPDRFPDMIRQAFREATSGCPAPVHIEIAGMVASVSMGELEDDTAIEPRFTSAPAFRPPAESQDVEAVLAALAEAERPLIVVGGGLMFSKGQSELRAFASKHQIPVATSLNAKAAILDSDPLSVGVVGLYSKETANRTAHEADLVFYIGSRTAGQVTNHWTAPFPDTKVIQLDIDPHGIGRNYPNIASLCGDAKTVLQQLLDASEPLPVKAEWLERISSIKQDYNESVAALRASDQQPIRPERALTELSEYLPDDAIVVCDTGNAALWAAQHLELRGENQMFIRAFGTLGWGFPAGLGAKCGFPDRPVFTFTGDGGFYYHFAELETAVRYGINTVTIVNNNYSVNQSQPVWAGAPEGRSFDKNWKYGELNFAQIAKDMGAFGIRVTDPKDIKDALDKAQASGLPAVVELVGDIDALAPNAWSAGPAQWLLEEVGDAAADKA